MTLRLLSVVISMACVCEAAQAAGKPVVATHCSEDIVSFRSHVYVVDTHDEFIAAIDKAIEENVIKKKVARMEAATGNSWQKRVEEFWKIIT